MDSNSELYNSRNINLYLKFMDEFHPSLNIEEVLLHAEMTMYES